MCISESALVSERACALCALVSGLLCVCEGVC